MRPRSYLSRYLVLHVPWAGQQRPVRGPDAIPLRDFAANQSRPLQGLGWLQRPPALECRCQALHQRLPAAVPQCSTPAAPKQQRPNTPVPALELPRHLSRPCCSILDCGRGAKVRVTSQDRFFRNLTSGVLVAYILLQATPLATYPFVGLLERTHGALPGEAHILLPASSLILLSCLLPFLPFNFLTHTDFDTLQKNGTCGKLVTTFFFSWEVLINTPSRAVQICFLPLCDEPNLLTSLSYSFPRL